VTLFSEEGVTVWVG